jgi:hypothetical protein
VGVLAPATPEGDSATSIERVPHLIQQLFAVVGELEALFEGRKFTLDGHLLGSLGDVIAAHRFGLLLLKPPAEGHDAQAPDGRLVQIKATQGASRIALRSEPEHLIVLRLLRDGGHEVVYNGPGAPVWAQCGKVQPANGQRAVGLGVLKALMAAALPSDQLESVND